MFATRRHRVMPPHAAIPWRTPLYPCPILQNSQFLRTRKVPREAAALRLLSSAGYARLRFRERLRRIAFRPLIAYAVRHLRSNPHQTLDFIDFYGVCPHKSVEYELALDACLADILDALDDLCSRGLVQYAPDLLYCTFFSRTPVFTGVFSFFAVQ